MRILCNPLNISYKYQHMKHSGLAFREGADPTLIYFKDKYYLFISMCGGFYYSDDMISWEYRKGVPDAFAYAPDVSSDGEYVYLLASHRFGKTKIYRSANPICEDFSLVKKLFACWDPHLNFESGNAYLFWGCSNRTPVYRMKLDKNLNPAEKKKAVIYGKPDKHGSERKDIFLKKSLIEKLLGNSPFIEGAYCNKINGKYYLQYAAPGTEYPTYSDGVYVSDKIDGKYIYQKHNPYSIVPSGFTVGAGHGSTIYDRHGNLWHASTIGVCVNHSYERRIGIWRADVDKDGILFCNQSFSDYPKEIPGGKFSALDISPKWMLLSYKASVTASSSADGFPPENAVDESIRTCWRSRSGEEGEWLVIDLGEEKTVGAIQLNFADVKVEKKKLGRKSYKGTVMLERFIDLSPLNKTRWRLFGGIDGAVWKIIKDKSGVQTDLSHDFIVLEAEKKYRYLKLELVSCPYNEAFAISGFRVFGNGGGEKPGYVKKSTAKRLSETQGVICWDKSDNAQGYNLSIGIAPDKLYTSVLIYGDTRCNITFLNAEVENYYYRIDAFNENGITKGETVRLG